MLYVGIKIKDRYARKHIHRAHHLDIGIGIIQEDSSVISTLLIFTIQGDVVIGIIAIGE